MRDFVNLSKFVFYTFLVFSDVSIVNINVFVWGNKINGPFRTWIEIATLWTQKKSWRKSEITHQWTSRNSPLAFTVNVNRGTLIIYYRQQTFMRLKYKWHLRMQIMFSSSYVSSDPSRWNQTPVCKEIFSVIKKLLPISHLICQKIAKHNKDACKSTETKQKT